MNDLGLMETIKVEHVFMFKVAEKWERPIKKCVDAILVMGYHMTESFRLLTWGAVGYLALVGTARLIEAVKSRKNDTNNNNAGDQSGGDISDEESPVLLDVPEKATGHRID